MNNFKSFAAYCAVFLVFGLCYGINHPVLLIGGLGGNQVYTIKKGADAEQEWLTASNLLYGDAFASKLRLQFNPYNNRTYSTSGSHIFPGSEGVWSTAYLGKIMFVKSYSYYNGIIEGLKRNSFYKVGATLLATPFDWRKAPNEQKRLVFEFKKKVELLYKNNSDTKVVIIAHSYGGIMTQYFLKHMSADWKAKYIKTLVAMAVPFGGTVKALRGLLHGENFDVPLVKSRPLRKLLTSFPTSYMLTAQYPAFGNRSLLEIKTSTHSVSFNSINFTNIFDYLDDKYGRDIYAVVTSTTDTCERPKNVEIVCIYSDKVPTLSKLTYNGLPVKNTDQAPQESKMVFKETPIMHFDDGGDGTVNIQSLEICNSWENVKTYKLHNIMHNDILENQITIDIINKIANGTI